MKKLAGIVLFVILFSCNGDIPKSDLLIGDWRLQVDTTKQQWQSIPHEFLGRLSYKFINDSLVDTKTPFYYFSTSGGQRSYKFLGTITKYRIKEDSLLFYDPSDSTWGGGRKIEKISHDSLLLRVNTGYLQTFVPLRYNNIKQEPIFDKIILSTSGCFGVCPITNIIINSNGEVAFYGERYVDQIGFYMSSITKQKYAELEYNFKKADLDNLPNKNFADWSDDETITTTFYKGNKIVKSIEDYGSLGPDELSWAYTALRYLYLELDLKKLDQNNLPYCINLHYLKFQKGNRVCNLTQAESFLLWDLLRKGVQTKKQFDQKYSLTFSRNYMWAPTSGEMEDPYQEEHKLVKIETDGRFYKFFIRDQPPITVDIGLDFIESNSEFLTFHLEKVSSQTM